MRLFTADDMLDMINARLASLAASHQCVVDTATLHPGTLMAHAHITWNGRRGHVQFPIEPIGTFEQHRTNAVIDDKFKQVLAAMQAEAA